MSRMFSYSKYNRPINNWNTKNVETFEEFLAFSSSFNQPISNLDLSSAKTIKGMFKNSTKFNQELSELDVSNVEDFTSAFEGTTYFRNTNALKNWNPSSAKNMTRMFYESAFNGEITDWNVSSVTDMTEMFARSNFNQPLNWNSSNVISFEGFLEQTSYFNKPITLDLSSAITIEAIFQNASQFNQDISHWDVSNVYAAGFDLGIKIKDTDTAANNNIKNGNIVITNIQFENVVTKDQYKGTEKYFTEGTTTGAGNGKNAPTWASGWTVGL